MITAEDTYDVADKVLEIPLDAIREAPDNVRSDLGDLEGLAASIKEVGVLQPITVMADPSGDTFMVLLGARRHAAAQLAGLMTIPAIVRSRSEDALRVKAMLIENVQRRDLSAIDEARTFERLETEFEITQSEIAAQVGCSQAHVSKRLSLLALPTKARQMVVDGELTIGAALELAKLAEHPDRLKVALNHIVKDNWDPERAAEQQLAEQEADEAMAAEVAKVEAKGIGILWTNSKMGMTSKEHEAKKKALGSAVRVVRDGGYHYEKVVEFAKPAEHAKEPCHRLVLEGAGETIERIPYCVDTKRHAAKGASKLKAATKSAAPRRDIDPELAERNRIREEIQAHRTEFVKELVRNRKYDRGIVTTHGLSRFVEQGYEHDVIAELLGLDVGDDEPMSVVGEYMHQGSDQLLRTVLAALLEGCLSAYANDEQLQLLNKFDYTPSDLEIAANAQRAAEREEERIEQAAWDAVDKLTLKAEELDSDIDDEAAALRDELDEGVSVTRAGEIAARLDAKFAELNELQPGDVVEDDGEGGHTIERATESDNAAHIPDADVTPACRICGCTDEEACEGGCTWVDDPDEVGDLCSVCRDALDDGDDVAGCPFPSCSLAAEHDGAHRIKLTDYAKAPKDCSSAEHMARLLIESVIKSRPRDHEVFGLHQELLAGVDDGRASEIHERLKELYPEDVLTDYVGKQPSAMEQSCRDLIATIPPEYAGVAELQQQLYRGLGFGEATAVKKKIKAIKATILKARK